MFQIVNQLNMCATTWIVAQNHIWNDRLAINNKNPEADGITSKAIPLWNIIALSIGMTLFTQVPRNLQMNEDHEYHHSRALEIPRKKISKNWNKDTSAVEFESSRGTSNLNQANSWNNLEIILPRKCNAEAIKCIKFLTTAPIVIMKPTCERGHEAENLWQR